MPCHGLCLWLGGVLVTGAACGAVGFVGVFLGAVCGGLVRVCVWPERGRQRQAVLTVMITSAFCALACVGRCTLLRSLTGCSAVHGHGGAGRRPMLIDALCLGPCPGLCKGLCEGELGLNYDRGRGEAAMGIGSLVLGLCWCLTVFRPSTQAGMRSASGARAAGRLFASSSG